MNNTFHFSQAKPVWEAGQTHTMNHTVCFCVDVPQSTEKIVLAAAASCSYIITVNGKMIAHGPQRCAHGFYCVDELTLDEWLTEPINTVAVRVAGYNCNSFAYLDQPSFFCGELRRGADVLAYTAEPMVGFRAYTVKERIQKVQRYSYQRPFAEAYDLSQGDFAYERGVRGNECVIRETEPKQFRNRTVPYGDYDAILPRAIQTGTITYSKKTSYYDNRLLHVSELLKGFPVEELTRATYQIYQDMDFSAPEATKPSEELVLGADCYLDLDFGRDYAGIFEFDVESSGARLMFIFDELMNEGQINPMRMSVTNMLLWDQLHGKQHLIAAEPYTLRYLRIAAVGGPVTIRRLKMNKIAFPSSKINAKYIGDDPVMEKIYQAALETFCANSVDVYMDCPSRERAGWLCDSFFTARAEKVLTGGSQLERAFLENFLLPDAFRNLPRGMLPMCYPADFYNGEHIVNWAMWYVLELQEYLQRTGDAELIRQAKYKMYELDRHLRTYENEFGLLEKVGGWVFVEWSKANELVQDVNFPSNMLYVGYKRAMAELYQDAAMAGEADRLAETIRQMSLQSNGFFCDNALRQDGKLELTGECTEVCQYYAFFFRIVTPESHEKLWQILRDDFGPDRAKTGKYPEIYPANAFIGNYLRLDILCRYGCLDQLRENIRGYFKYMAETTGTLWEMITPTASCNHGFASHVLYWMDQLGDIAHL